MIYLQLESDGVTIKRFPIDEPMLRSMYPTISYPEGYFINGGELPNDIAEVFFTNGTRITTNLTDMIVDAMPTLVSGVWVLQEGDRASTQRLDADRVLKLAQLSRNVDNMVKQYADSQNIPDAELQTWVIQSQEAITWGVDNTKTTPFLDMVATARGIDRESLLEKTLVKSQMYLGLLALIIGKRQAIEEALLAATTPSELEAISLEITLPTNG